MKKIFSLLTVSVLGVTSITNVTAFSQTKTTYNQTNLRPNHNFGGADSDSFNLSIEMNKSAWDFLTGFDFAFIPNNSFGFGGFLIQYANNNHFDHKDMVNINDAVAFSPDNIAEKYFDNFGYWNDNKSETAACIFNNYFAGSSKPYEGGEVMTNWYQNTLKYWNVSNMITLSFHFTYDSGGLARGGYKLNYHAAVLS